MTDDALRAANRAFSAAYPGEPARPQPVHTVYGGAHLFRHDTAPRLAALARAALQAYAPDGPTLAHALGWGEDHATASALHARVAARLASQPVEDFRIDFEDGYGVRSEAEEDAHARAVGEALAAGWVKGTLPPWIGIRVKPLDEQHRMRSRRTLTMVLESMLARTGGVLPAGFTVTLPKVTVAEQVAHLAHDLGLLEQRFGLEARTLGIEIMVETPQLILGRGGRCELPEVVQAGKGRVTGAHFGPYDYTGALGISASEQRIHHPACGFARHVMQVSLAGTGVWLSDGPTTILPVAPHRGDAATISAAQQAENRASVHRAWRMHHDDVAHSLASGFYQGWDLHPAQLVSRYAALFAFFHAGAAAAGTRLRNFIERAAQATRVGNVFDDAATGQGLLNHLVRAVGCGAISEAEALAYSGLALDELRSRSFPRILALRDERLRSRHGA